jgi:glyoxylase-like metal-dependent hydrolase (beta-lactamase superfamily II)
MNVSWPLPHVARLDQRDGVRLLSQFAVLGDGRTLLVDAGLPETPERTTAPFLDEHDRRTDPVSLVITHLDADHCGGTSTLQDLCPRVTVFAHAKECPPLGNPEAVIRERYAQFATSDDVRLGGEAYERIRRRLGDEFSVDVLVDGTCELIIGDEPCVIIHVPGHSAGHSAVWLPKDGTLIAGDAFMGAGIKTMDGHFLFPPQFIRPSLYLTSLWSVQKLHPDVLLCAHEKTMTGDEPEAFLETSRRMAEGIVETVAMSVRRGPKTLLQICGDVRLSNDEWAELADGEFAPSVAGCLLEMEDEGSVVVDHSAGVRHFEGSAR